jgi:hypothetical protein
LLVSFFIPVKNSHLTRAAFSIFVLLYTVHIKSEIYPHNHTVTTPSRYNFAEVGSSLSLAF